MIDFLTLLEKARQVTKRFGVDPTRTWEGFDDDAAETVEELHAVFFGGGLTRKRPNVKITCKCERKTFRDEVLKEAARPSPVKMVSDCTYEFLGERFPVGRLVHGYTEMTLSLKGKRAKKRGRQKTGFVNLVMTAILSRRDTPDPATSPFHP